MAISASDVKQLREKTGAGPADCKKALESTNGDFAAAEKILKEKGLAAVEKRAGRATNEGKIFIKIQNGTAVLVELAAETDFVARNPEFIALGELVISRALEKGYTEPNEELANLVLELATKIRENMGLKRLTVLKANAGEILTQYIHGDGAIGVVVKVAADKPEVLQSEELKAFIFTLALHVAAFNPVALDRSKIDPAFLEEQSVLFRKQIESDEATAEKPEKVREGILRGKIDKYLKSICFLDQGYVKDEKLSVAQALSEYNKKLGAVLTIVDYIYFKVGE
ncbi:MAG: translation elongation factor Ts [Spirochaetaceae bacterium]|jgi:elongation factor Ts|nr:translation elongation factor Ts [Spirochaetaceae bacterium]